jgi:hypothetical protein
MPKSKKPLPLKKPSPHKEPRPKALSKAKLAELIEQATVDAYDESEQTSGFYTMLDENLTMPFETQVLGMPVVVQRLDMTDDEQIVAVCVRGKSRQHIPVLDLPLPYPPPDGVEWIEAYRQWRRGS